MSSLFSNDFFNKVRTRLNVEAKNLIINGGFDVWQRGTSFAAPATGEYLCDRFRTYYFGIVPNITREEDVPSWSDSKYSAKVGINTAIASPTTNDFLNFRQFIEGNFFKHLIGKDIIISFSVKSNKAGQHGMYLYTTENSQASYNTSYTINQADTWERKKVKIPAAVGFEDTFGTDTGISLAVLWLMTDIEAVPSAVDTWEAGLTNAGNNSNVQVGTDISDYWQIADIMLYEDTGQDIDVPFQRAGRNYAEELQLCQRYYQKFSCRFMTRWKNNNHVDSGGTTLPTSMRDIPLISYSNIQFESGSNSENYINTGIGSYGLYAVSKNTIGMSYIFTSGGITAPPNFAVDNAVGVTITNLTANAEL